MENRKKLSTVIIAKNEGKRIEKCIRSVEFSDEILVVDNNSTDQTRAISRKAGAGVIQTDSHDFSIIRTIGFTNTKGSWILYVDADEIVTEALKKEIELLILEDPPHQKTRNYYIRRQNYYMGHLWPYQDRMQRLFYRPDFIGWTGQLHETASVRGDFGELMHPLVHDTHRNLEEMVEKTNEWSDIEAQLRFDAGHPMVVPWRLCRVMCTGFFLSYIAQGGWRTGTVGLIESIYQAFSLFITYAKLWEKQQRH